MSLLILSIVGKSAYITQLGLERRRKKSNKTSKRLNAVPANRILFFSICLQ